MKTVYQSPELLLLQVSDVDTVRCSLQKGGSQKDVEISFDYFI